MCGWHFTAFLGLGWPIKYYEPGIEKKPDNHCNGSIKIFLDHTTTVWYTPEEMASRDFDE